jgi:hypothetical protein
VTYASVTGDNTDAQKLYDNILTTTTEELGYKKASGRVSVTMDSVEIADDFGETLAEILRQSQLISQHSTIDRVKIIDTNNDNNSVNIYIEPSEIYPASVISTLWAENKALYDKYNQTHPHLFQNPEDAQGEQKDDVVLSEDDKKTLGEIYKISEVLELFDVFAPDMMQAVKKPPTCLGIHTRNGLSLVVPSFRPSYKATIDKTATGGWKLERVPA